MTSSSTGKCPKYGMRQTSTMFFGVACSQADGRAATVHDAILLHEGEALESKTAYLQLSERDQAALRIFLLSLTRHPTLLME